MPKKKLTIDMNGVYNSKCPLFICRELDSLTLCINVVEGSDPFDLVDAEIEVYGLRADGERPKQVVDIKLEEELLTIKLNNCFNCVRGINFIELQIVKEGEVYTSPSIPFYVEPRLRSELSFVASTVAQIQGANAEAEKHLVELGRSIEQAIEKFNSLNEAISNAVTPTQTLNKLIQDATEEEVNLDNKYQEVKEWEEGFNINETLPQMKEDIDYLKEKPTTIKVY